MAYQFYPLGLQIIDGLINAMKKYTHWKFFIVVVIVSFFSLDCGVLNYHEKVLHETIEFIETTRDKYEKQYIGKSQELVFADLGNPYFVRNNVFISGETYDEEWAYRIFKGQGITKTAHNLRFYIKGSKVAAVSVW